MPLDPPTRFAGLGNFRALFTTRSCARAPVNTVALHRGRRRPVDRCSVPSSPLALQRRFRWRGIILALIVLPWALPAVVEAVIWSWIYDPTFGVLNSALQSVGVISGYHVWLGLDRSLTIVLIEIVQVWQITPLAALLILAALQSIPPGPVRGGARRRRRPLGDVPAHHAAADPARPGRGHGRGADPVAEHLRPGLRAQRDRAAAAPRSCCRPTRSRFNNLNFGQGYALSLLVTVATMLLSLVILAVVYRRVEF